MAHGYESGVETAAADMIVALDMFFMIENPTAFLKELSRISKKDGILVIDDGHQSRDRTKEKIKTSCTWNIIEETKDHLKCVKIL